MSLSGLLGTAAGSEIGCFSSEEATVLEKWQALSETILLQIRGLRRREAPGVLLQQNNIQAERGEVLFVSECVPPAVQVLSGGIFSFSLLCKESQACEG